MAKTNYNKMSSNAKEDVAPVTETTSLDVENTVAETEAPEVEITADTEPEVDATANAETEELLDVIGVVCNCAKLNVRQDPDIKSDVVTVISAGDEVVIDTEDSTEDWYSVCVDRGSNYEFGYCMKKYISVK